MNQRPDYSKLALQGDGWHQETFCLALVAAGRALGVETDYETLCARSTHAFAPAVDFVNDCTDLLQCQGWLGPVAAPMREAAASVGLGLGLLDMPRYAGAANDAAAKSAHQRVCRERVGEALAAGQVVLTTGGWESQKGASVEPWFAGVITAVRDDGTVLGAHPNGRTDNVLREFTPGEVYTVTRLDTPLDVQSMHTRMLRDAVSRIRARAPFAKGTYHVFGVEACDELIRIMSEVPGFCVPCQTKKGNGWAAADHNARSISDRAQIAARYLRKTSPVPEAACPALESAATHYDRIVALLQPALTGEGGPHYHDFIGALPKQKAHAENVLKAVKTELAAAADALELALAAPKVKREAGKVWIEGVERLRFGQGRDNQFIAAMHVALRTTGESVDYDRLMGYSGAAFRLHIWDKELCPSSPDLLGGFNHAHPAAAAIGYTVAVVPCGDADAQRQRELRARVVKSIDAGVPVIANSLMGHGSYEVVVGYADGGAVLLARSYEDPDDSYSQGRAWPWSLVFLEKTSSALSPLAASLQSLGIAVELAKTDSYDRGGKQWSGFAAYDRWITELTRDELFAKLEPDRQAYLADANGWIYLALIDARASAARYLRLTAGALGQPAKAHLLAAAQAYEEVAHRLTGGQQYAPASWQLPGGSWTKAVAHPDAPPVTAWTPDMRRAEARALADCKTIEQRALAEIEAALAAEGVNVAASASVAASIKKAPAGAGAKVKREARKVWIEGAPVLGWDKGVQCTYAGALAAASTITEHPCAYDDIMGWSGLAFRVRWYQAKEGRAWCPSSPVGEVPQPMGAVAEATGWTMRHEWHWGNPKMERFAPEIVAAIDGGRPILTYDETFNVAVICGYAAGGKAVLLRRYDGEQGLAEVPTTKLGPMLMFFKEHVAPLPPRAALTAGLKIAVDNWSRDAEQAEKGRYWYGAEGLREWAADLAEVKGLTDAQLRSLFFVSWWNQVSLIDARSAAVRFLRMYASELPGERQAALLRAADLYDRANELFRRAFRNRNAFLSPGTGKTFADWTAAVRWREVEILGASAKLEAQAVATIEAALRPVVGRT